MSEQRLPADIARELMKFLVEKAGSRIIDAKKELANKEAGQEMKDVNEVFDGVKNTEFKALQFVEGLTRRGSGFHA